MWKLLTGVIAEKMYNYLERERILPEKTKRIKIRKSWNKELAID